MRIINGYVYGEDRQFAQRDVFVKDHLIVDSNTSLTDESTIDAAGLYVIPGLIDVHSHGACGHDFSDADSEGLRTILRYQRRCGVTSYCPTSMTLPEEQLLRIFAAPAQVRESPDQAHIVGLNMEGPFLDPGKKGAHAETHILDPDVALFRKCNAACRHMIKLVTLAPNARNAAAFIRELRDETNISLGHSSADYQTSKAALEAGAHHITHLFNAMMPFAHRDPGLVGAAAETPGCMAELICDGIHIHESMVRAAFRLFPDRIVLISDSMRAAGMPDGTYDLGGQQVTVAGQLATLADGTIAGSVTNLYDCMKTAVSFGIPLEEAIGAATVNPAKSIGIYNTVGSLTPGKRADILLADKELNLVRVI